MDNYRDKLTAIAEKMNIEINENDLNSLIFYMDFILKKNETINLTAIRNRDDFIIKHIADSMTLSDIIKKNSKVIDIGTGAGIPGIPLKLIRDDLEMTLLDSKEKKIKILEEVIEKMKLNNIYAKSVRVEDFGRGDGRSEYDCAIARSVAILPVIAEYAIPLLRPGGIFIAMKAVDSEDTGKAEKALDILGAKIIEERHVKLPFSDIERKIIIIEKHKETPVKYPRRAGIPAKKPLGC
jgi:16S rRNA (guanine527-N7)-methyltransferase